MEEEKPLIEEEIGIREEMLARALKSEEDIKAGRVYTLEEAKARIAKKFEK